MRLKGRIKELEQKTSEAKPEPRVHCIVFSARENNLNQLVAEYRKNGGKLPIFAVPGFNTGIDRSKLISQNGSSAIPTLDGANSKQL